MILKAIFPRASERERGGGAGGSTGISLRGKNMLIDHILNYSNKKYSFALAVWRSRDRFDNKRSTFISRD